MSRESVLDARIRAARASIDGHLRFIKARRLIADLAGTTPSIGNIIAYANLSAYVAGLEAEVGRLRAHVRDRDRMLVWDDEVLKGPERLRLDRRIRGQRMSIRFLWRTNDRLQRELDAAQRGRAAEGGNP